MKKNSTIFLQIVIVLIGIAALGFLLWEPHLEGRNAHATPFEIYFNDPFLAYAYTGSLAFFAALYQAFKALGFVRQNKTFSRETVKALRTIKYCAMTLVGFLVGAEIWIFTVERGKSDDIAGGVAMGLFLIIISAIVAITAAVLERRLRNAINIK